MPNNELLIDPISQNLIRTINDKYTYSSKIALNYAYNQLQIHRETSNQGKYKTRCGNDWNIPFQNQILLYT